MTALTSSSASHYFAGGSLDTNMVQEVHGGYDAYSAMMRHNPSYGNMHNLGGYNAAFSGTGQPPQPPMGQYGDYYHGGGNNLQAAGDTSSWSSVMYPSTSVSPPTSSSRHTNLLDHDWPQTQYVGNVTVQPHETTSHMQHLGQVGTGSATPTGSGSGGGNSSYSSYRGSGCLPTMPIEYGPTSSGHTSGMTPTMTPSPTPGGVVMGGSPPGGSGGNANRQTNRPPYDWMKKVAYPSTPSTELGSVGKGNGSKTRTKDKYRVVYTDHQRLELEKEFHYSRYITIRRKAELAQNLALSERQVKIWFQNRRAKERKQNKKRDEAMGIKTERPDSLPLMSPLGGACDGGPQQQGHCGGSQGQQMTLGGAMVAPVVVGAGATPDMGGLHGAVGGPHPCHTPPMSTHSPPMSGHHS